MDFVDLHMHTTHSDGSLTPPELAERIAESGVRAVALTDHDTLGGVSALREALAANGVTVVPGCELSATDGNADIHILGYCVSENDASFEKELERFVYGRTERAKVMVDKLRAHGVPITFEMVQEIAGDSAVGRPHVADAILQLGIVQDREEIFQKWIGATGPCYVPKTTLQAAEAIQMIHDVGGVAVLAHPATLKHDELIPGMIAAGLDGLEVMHPRQDDDARRRYHALAKKNGLLVSGGSDFHGKRTPTYSIGMLDVPYELLDAIQTAAAGGGRRTVALAL